MRAIWKGAVSFGLVNVPVRLFSATENHDVQFRQVHEKDGGRIRYKRVCAIDGEEVPYSDIAKGYEAADGQMVVLSDEDMKSLPSRSTKEISIEKFVPSEQIDPLLFDKSYYLEPDKTGLKPYVLLRDALEKADRMALVTVSVRSRMTLAVLRVRDGVIVLQTLLWADEVRAPEFESLSEETHATSKELAMASSLVDSLSGDYVPDEFEDDYSEAVEPLVASKIEGGDITTTPEAEGEETEVVDLLAALQRSVDKAKAAKSGGPSASASADGRRRGRRRRDSDEAAPPPAKKTAAKKATSTAKKSTAKKSTTTKAAAKKASVRQCDQEGSDEAGKLTPRGPHCATMVGCRPSPSRSCRPRLRALPANPRVVVSGNTAVPWEGVRAVDTALERLRHPRAQRAPRHTRPRGRDRGDVLRRPRYAASPAAALRAVAPVARAAALLAHARCPTSCSALRAPARRPRQPGPRGQHPAGGDRRACRARGGLVVAVVNAACRARPVTRCVPLEHVDLAIEVDEPLPTHAPLEPDDESRLIGERVAATVRDGATLQLGIGAVPDATLPALTGAPRSADVDRDVLRRRARARRGRRARRRTTRSSRRSASARASSTTGSTTTRGCGCCAPRRPTTPASSPQQRSMTSVNTALEVDLFGQANASRINARIHSGFGGQTDFIVGALHSAGRPVVHRAAVVAPQGRRVDDRAAARRAGDELPAERRRHRARHGAALGPQRARAVPRHHRGVRPPAGPRRPVGGGQAASGSPEPCPAPRNHGPQRRTAQPRTAENGALAVTDNGAMTIRIGLSSSSVYPDNAATAFATADRLGYDGVEIMVWTDPVTQEAGALNALAELHGIPILSVHAPTLLLTQRVWGTDPWGKVDRSIELALEVGAPTVVLHPPFRWQREYAAGFVDGIALREHDSGVRLAVENMYPWRTARREVLAYLPHWDPTTQPYDNVTIDLSHTATAGSDAVEMVRCARAAAGAPAPRRRAAARSRTSTSCPGAARSRAPRCSSCSPTRAGRATSSSRCRRARAPATSATSTSPSRSPSPASGCCRRSAPRGSEARSARRSGASRGGAPRSRSTLAPGPASMASRAAATTDSTSR